MRQALSLHPYKRSAKGSPTPGFHVREVGVDAWLSLDDCHSVGHSGLSSNPVLYVQPEIQISGVLFFIN